MPDLILYTLFFQCSHRRKECPTTSGFTHLSERQHKAPPNPCHGPRALKVYLDCPDPINWPPVPSFTRPGPSLAPGPVICGFFLLAKFSRRAHGFPPVPFNSQQRPTLATINVHAFSMGEAKEGPVLVASAGIKAFRSPFL